MVGGRQLAFENVAVGGKCKCLVFLAKQCSSSKTLQQVHAQMVVKSSIHSPNNHLLSKAIHLKNFTYASLLFSHIAPHPNDYAFNIMIRALTTTWHHYPLALTLFHRMMSLSLSPNNFTFPFFFLSCANLAALSPARAAHSLVFKLALHSDPHTTHSLITMYSRCGRVAFARKVFDEIPRRDLVSWNSMIAGYAKAGCAREAVEVFGEMGRRDGFEPDEMSLVSVLGACGELGDLELGRWVEGFVVERGMTLNSYIGSALISMYAKCGDLGSARRIFDGMAARDVITWNAVISGYAQNGMADEAISLFHAMKEDCVTENKITLTAVLSACATIGALDLGKQIDEYASQRGFQHDIFVATALIDMYAKCGSLASAQRVFKEMPQKNEASWNAMISALASHGKAKEALSLFQCMSDEGGDKVTLGALLGACRSKKNVDIGERVIRMILEVDPSNSGNYIISSKIYANLNMWEDSARMRLLMRQKGITKTPGCSWIEVENHLHEFHAGDGLCLDSIDLSNIIDLLYEELKREGYVPKVVE
ncbi:hypothetical protein JHK86_039160 [Glycine max]|nr:hypothetical protein JHK86_039160 [Glycine max]